MDVSRREAILGTAAAALAKVSPDVTVDVEEGKRPLLVVINCRPLPSLGERDAAKRIFANVVKDTELESVPIIFSDGFDINIIEDPRIAGSDKEDSEFVEVDTGYAEAYLERERLKRSRNK